MSQPVVHEVTNTPEDLPIHDFRAEILQSVGESQVTIITAETGAGKSTQVPQMLATEGYEVIMTQPRVVAARSLAERIADEQGVELGTTVGYKTAREGTVGNNTKILLCTDGLQTIRELTGGGTETKKNQVLVLDEVHEWNTNLETLVAWSKRRCAEDPNFKVVLMSATLEAQELSQFFDAAHTSDVIEVPGRTFDVEKHEVPLKQNQTFMDGAAEQAARLAAEGKNTLVFMPGKAEIAEVEKSLKARNIDAEIVPLHGELSKEEQKRAFEKTDRPKIVIATNVAQTSLTIEDIDAVVDSGMEKRKEVHGAVEGLFLRPVSQADCQQRAGRAGRTKAGEYYLVSETPLHKREEFPLAEIERSLLDRVVLRLARSGVDATELEFFHQPDKKHLEAAKAALHNLGAVDESGEITELGRQLDRLPIKVHYGRMLVEAKKLGVAKFLIPIIALQEAGNIRHNKNSAWRRLTKETESDALANLDLLRATQGKSKDQIREMGLIGKTVWESRRTIKDLTSALGMNGRNGRRSGRAGTIDITREPTAEQRENILKAVASGMIDRLYHSNGQGRYYRDGVREISKGSVVQSNHEWVVGEALDIDVPARRGLRKTLHLLQFVSKVNPEWLAEYAPHLLEVEPTGEIRFLEHGQSIVPIQVRFGDQIIRSDELVPEGRHLDVVYNQLANLVAQGHHHEQEHYQHIRTELSELRHQLMLFDPDFAEDIGDRLNDRLEQMYRSRGITNLHSAFAEVPRLTLDQLLTDQDLSYIEMMSTMYPERVAVDHVLELPIRYLGGRDVDGQHVVIAQVQVWSDDLARLRGAKFPDCRLQLKVFMPDGRERLFNDLEVAIDSVGESYEQLAWRRREAKLIESGEAVQNFGGALRSERGAMHHEYWVVTADGKLRPPDADTPQESRWRVVAPEEIALGLTMQDGKIGTGVFDILHRPSEASDEQRQAIHDLERQLGTFQGAFEMDPEDLKVRQKILSDIAQTDAWLEQILAPRPNWYGELVSTTGLDLGTDPQTLYSGSVFEPDELTFDQSADGQPAAETEAFQINPEQAVVVLAYQKNGSWHTAMKLIDRAAEPEEELTAYEESEEQAALAALVAKYGPRY